MRLSSYLATLLLRASQSGDDSAYRFSMAHQHITMSSRAMFTREEGRPGEPNPACRIAVVGAGPVGINLAKRFVHAGWSVSISNSRHPSTLRQQERDTGAVAVDVTRAVAEADFIVLGIPEANVPAVAMNLRPHLRPGVVILDAGNYYPSRDGRIKALDDGVPDSVWVSQHFSAPVAKAFNNIIASNITLSARGRGSPARVTLPVSGDDAKAVEAVMALTREVGFDAYNAGALEESWRYQPGQPAYCTEPNLKQLLVLLSKADRSRGPLNRDKARGLTERLPEDFPTRILLRVARLSAGLDRWDVRNYIAVVSLAFAILKGSIAGR